MDAGFQRKGLISELNDKGDSTEARQRKQLNAMGFPYQSVAAKGGDILRRSFFGSLRNNAKLLRKNQISFAIDQQENKSTTRKLKLLCFGISGVALILWKKEPEHHTQTAHLSSPCLFVQGHKVGLGPFLDFFVQRSFWKKTSFVSIC